MDVTAIAVVGETTAVPIAVTNDVTTAMNVVGTGDVVTTEMPVAPLKTAMSHFGYQYIVDESSSINDMIEDIQGVVSPLECHRRCEKSEGCTVWSFGYNELTSNRLYPSCELYKAATFKTIPDDSLWRSVSGDLENVPFTRKVGECTPESCKRAVSSYPFFMGPFASMVYKDSCSIDDQYCLSLPATRYDTLLRTEPHCCVPCGVAGHQNCDTDPFLTGVMPSPKSQLFERYSGIQSLWMSQFYGEPKGWQTTPSFSHGWGSFSTDYVFVDPTVLSSSMVENLEGCIDLCDANEECVAWSWMSSKVISVLQSCSLIQAYTNIVPYTESSSQNIHAVGFRSRLPMTRIGDAQSFFHSVGDDEMNSMLTSNAGGSVGDDTTVSVGDNAGDAVETAEAFFLKGNRPYLLDMSPFVNNFSPYLSTRSNGTIRRLHGADKTQANADLSSLMTVLINGLPKDLTSILSETMIELENQAIRTLAMMASKPGLMPSDALPTDSDLSYFEINGDFLQTFMSEWAKAKADQMDDIIDFGTVDGFIPTGIVPVCTHPANNYECILVCMKMDSTVSGFMNVGVGYSYAVGNSTITGPVNYQPFFITGVCEILMADPIDPVDPVDPVVTTTPSPVMTTIGGQTTKQCNKSGYTGVVAAAVVPIKTTNVESVDACHIDCLDTQECLAYNHQGRMCSLMQNDKMIDRYYVQDQARCTRDCANDSECTNAMFVMGSCSLYDTPFITEVKGGLSVDTAMGPIECAESTNIMPRLDVPEMSSNATNLEANINPIDKLNHLNHEEFMPPAHPAVGCAPGFTEIQGRCLKVHHKRLARDDADRECSDQHAMIFMPTQAIMDELCTQGLVDCVSDNRSSRMWTSLTLDYDASLLLRGRKVDVDVAVTPATDRDQCVIANFNSNVLNPSTCGSYCVAPASILSTAADAPMCTVNGATGRFALMRLPFICESYANDATAPASVPFPNRKVSYVDGQGVTRCAHRGEDIVGGDLWNTATWADPMNNWQSCEGYCRAVNGQGCKGYTFVPPSCHINKAELDKGWAASLVFSQELSLKSDNFTNEEGQTECNAICSTDPECNSGATFVQGVCYLKNAMAPRRELLQWSNNISGPSPCDAPEKPLVPEAATCNLGYYLSTNGTESICVAIGLERTTAPEAHRSCVRSGGVLASPKTAVQADLLLNTFCRDKDVSKCIVERGPGALDGVFYMGLGSTLPGINGTWKWIDKSPLTYDNRFGGQGSNPPLVYFGWPTVQPDNTSGMQLCSYYYPRDSPQGNLNGGWGDEDCDTKCLQPASANAVMRHAPVCNDGAGRMINLGRRYICTADEV